MKKNPQAFRGDNAKTNKQRHWKRFHQDQKARNDNIRYKINKNRKEVTRKKKEEIQDPRLQGRAPGLRGVG